MKVRFTFILVFISVFSFAQGIDHVLIPGTSFYMIPPTDFEIAKGFEGFLHKSTGALIMVNEIEAPYALILGRFSKDALQIKEMTLVGQQELKLNNTDATLITATQSEDGVENYKKMLLFGEKQKTLLVTAVYPESNPELASGIKRSLLSTVYKQPAHFQPLNAIRFNLKIPGSTFRLTRCIDSSVIFTRDGKIPTTGPYLIVLKQTARVDAKDRERYCLEQLKQHAATDSVDVKSTTETTADGMSGYEIVAERKGKPGVTELIYQTIFFDNQVGNYSIFGVVSDNNEKDVNCFRSIANSLRRGPYRTRVPDESGDTVLSYWCNGAIFDTYWETTAEQANSYWQVWKDEGRWMVHSFYKSGEREMIATYEDDSLKMREGLCRRWFENGRLADSTYYVKGKLEGHQTWYFENGQKSEEGSYMAGDPKTVMFWTEEGMSDLNGVAGVKQPSFKGDLIAYLLKNLRYPESARNYHQEGKAYIKFEITAQGKIVEARTARSSGTSALDHEALRVIEIMPDWNPASDHNRRKKVVFTMPITFRLD